MRSFSLLTDDGSFGIMGMEQEAGGIVFCCGTCVASRLVEQAVLSACIVSKVFALYIIKEFLKKVMS